MVKPEIVNDERMIPLARDICKKIEEELEYPGTINGIRGMKILAEKNWQDIEINVDNQN